MFIKLYAIAFFAFFVIDMIWLGLVARNFYREQLGALIAPNINWAAAIIFYLVFIAGLVLFVVSPAVDKNSWTHALVFGALFGFICYATYDLTNLATLKGWPVAVTVVDLAWGATLGATVSVITYGVYSKFFAT